MAFLVDKGKGGSQHDTDTDNIDIAHCFVSGVEVDGHAVDSHSEDAQHG